MKLKNQSIVFFFLMLVSLGAQGQKKAASPAENTTGIINGATISINYGSPSVKGRAIWGALVPYNKIWRAGANDATTFETNKTITIQGKQLPAGKYSFFVIPSENESILIFNKENKQWGAYDYKESSDQLRVTVKNKKSDVMTEKLQYKIADSKVELHWENLIIGFDVK